MKAKTTHLSLFIAIIAMAFINLNHSLAQTWTDQHPVAPSGFTYDGTNVYKVSLNKMNLYVSSDEGMTWVNDTVIFSGQTLGTTLGLVVFVTANGRLVTTRGKNSSHKIIYSDDLGDTWVETSTTISDNLYSAAETNGVIYLSPVSGIPRYSTDNGLTWIQVPLDVRGAVAGADNSEFYVPRSDSLVVVNSTTMLATARYPLSQTTGRLKSFGQEFFHFKIGKVYYSTDKQTWTDLTSNSVFVANAAEDVAVKNGTIYLASYHGVYFTNDNGTSWTKIDQSSNLNFAKVITTDNYLIGGYNFSGAGYSYRAALPESTNLDDHVYANSLVNLYPNPFENHITVATNDIQETVQIRIYDMLGHLIQSQNVKGTETVILQNATAHVYIYELTNPQTNELIKTGKLIRTK